MLDPAFLRPRLVGARFDGGEIPCEMLSDLSILKEMVIEVAKWRYLEENPDRERSPRGFADGIEINLTGIEAGSAIPAFRMRPSTPQLDGFPVEHHEHFHAACERIVAAIDAADRGESVAKYLPQEALRYFDKFGSNLRDGESIQFSVSSRDTPVSLSPEVRRKLVVAARVEEVTNEFRVRGSIHEVDLEKMTFEMHLLGGRKVSGVILDVQRQVVVNALNKYIDAGKVLIQGIGTYDRPEHIVSLDSVEHIALLDPLDVPVQLGELREMEDGWLDGEGVAPSQELLDWLSERFDRWYQDDLALPHVYPTVDGGVQAEWSISLREISLSVDPASREGAWHALDMGTNSEEERTLDLTDDSGWRWVAEQIHSLSEAPQ